MAETTGRGLRERAEDFLVHDEACGTVRDDGPGACDCIVREIRAALDPPPPPPTTGEGRDNVGDDDRAGDQSDDRRAVENGVDAAAQIGSAAGDHRLGAGAGALRDAAPPVLGTGAGAPSRESLSATGEGRTPREVVTAALVTRALDAYDKAGNGFVATSRPMRVALEAVVAELLPSSPEAERCPRDSGWCDGESCRDMGINCPKADPLPSSPVGGEAAVDHDYVILCGECGSMTPSAAWSRWKYGEDEIVPAEPGDMDPIERCPVCQHEHRDDDTGGTWSGSRAEMESTRAELLAEPDGPWAESWAYALRLAAAPVEGDGRSAREALWMTCPECHGHGAGEGDGSGLHEGGAYHTPPCGFCDGACRVPRVPDALLAGAFEAFGAEYRRHFPSGGDAQDHDEAQRAGVEAVAAVAIAHLLPAPPASEGDGRGHTQAWTCWGYGEHGSEVDCSCGWRWRGEGDPRAQFRQHLNAVPVVPEAGDGAAALPTTIDEDLVRALVWTRLGSSRAGRHPGDDAIRRAEGLGLLSHHGIWHATPRGEGALVALGMLDGTPAPRPKTVLVLWVVDSDGHYSPQLIGAYEDGLVDDPSGLYEDWRAADEQRFRDAAGDGRWRFFTTEHELPIPAPPAEGDGAREGGR